MFVNQPAGERDRTTLNTSFNSSSMPRSPIGIGSSSSPNGSVDNSDGIEIVGGTQMEQPRYNITNVTYQPEQGYGVNN